jgi:hypothetical protein
MPEEPENPMVTQLRMMLQQIDDEGLSVIDRLLTEETLRRAQAPKAQA